MITYSKFGISQILPNLASKLLKAIHIEIVERSIIVLMEGDTWSVLDYSSYRYPQVDRTLGKWGSCFGFGQCRILSNEAGR